ncbi:MAG: RagB/SusD family nutrient uptake outer membrane protein, partial [Prevotellaceae bacterium]|nr:RagB/SusD family nutrient uptake outer membrane protein [Prevotellaceae bacterium]
MKKIIHSALVLVAALVFASCNDLDLDPIGSLDSELFFGSDQDAVLAVNGVYAGLVESESVVVAWCVGLGSDETQNGQSMPDGSGAELSALQFNPGPNQHIYWIWGDHYYGIANATALIDKLNNPATPVSDAIRKRVRGEAEFLRAYYYSILVQIFGEVPLVNQSGINAGVNVEREGVHTVYAAVVKDLENAAADLEDYPDGTAYNASDKGRVTQGSAYGLLAKVYLVWAQTEGATDVDGKYAKAIEYAGKVTGYSLEEKFHANWEKTNRYGKESLFAANYVVSQESFGDGGNHLTHCAFSSGFSQQTPHVVLSDRTYYDRFDSRDQRKESTFLSQAINPETNELFVFDMPRYAKNIDLDAPLASSKVKELQAPILRYAEVLLTRAEAEIERSGGDLSKAAADINEVRRRAYRVD